MPLGEREISDTFPGEAKAWQGFLTPAGKSQVLVASELGKVGVLVGVKGVYYPTVAGATGKLRKRKESRVVAHTGDPSTC